MKILDDEIDFAAFVKETDLTQGYGTRESEMTIVSILLNYPEALLDCENLTPDYFLTTTYREIFTEIRGQANAGYDVVTIAQAIPHISMEEVHEIANFNDHSARSLSRHVRILIDSHKSRKLYGIADLVQTLAFEKSPIQDRIDKVSSALMDLEDKEDFGEWIDAHESAIKHLDLIEQREAGTVVGMACGIGDFDELLDGGFQRGNLVVIGARPSMGKSALGLTIGLQMSQEYTVGFISMEMSRADVSDRQAAILGSMSISDIKRPKRGLQYDRLVESVERSKTRKFYVVEQGGLNILQVRAKAKALKRRKGLDVLIVDYIGLMSGTDSKVSRAYQIEEMSRGLKTLAKELGIVVICLAQVNRGAADKGNSPPGLHELRDSGAIEQDADVVGFIHRPIMQNPDLGEKWKHYALLRIAKNRQGRTGDVHLFYVGEQTKFGQWSGEIPSNAAPAEPKVKGFNR
jgi:replicative DNA helicase